MNLAAIRAGSMGTLQTTWAGYDFGIDGEEKSWSQYVAWILAAHYAWSGDETPPASLPFSARDLFIESWRPRVPVKEDLSGFHVNLSPSFNRSLADDGNGSGWLGYGPDNDLSALDLAQGKFGETRFNLMSNAAGDSALMLSGPLNPAGTFPRSIAVSFDEARPAREMHFLMASAFAAEDFTPVGEIRVLRAGATGDKIPLVYARNIFATTDERVGAEARIAWTGQAGSGAPIHLWDLAWANPHPNNPIVGFELRSGDSIASPVLFAVTGVDP